MNLLALRSNASGRAVLLGKQSLIRWTASLGEAATAGVVFVAALTVYDMCKAVDRAMRIEGVRLLRKTGGKSDFTADP